MGSTKLLPIILGLIGVISATPGSDEFRSNFEFFDTNLAEPNYRLLDNVQPTYLNIDLDVYLAESRFNGLVQIEVNVLEANLSQIVLHQKVVAISTVTVLSSRSQHVPLQFPDPFETDDYFELLKINFASPIAIGTYTITISYLGQINENPLDRGFYKGYYYLNNQKREYATTQFQPFHARKAFPCFDEPQFKSRYVLSITRDSTLSPSYSNMAINETQVVSTGRIRETFLPTPIISAYLIAFHVSDFVETTSTGTVQKPFGIISRQGVTDQHSYAADIGLKITNELDDYFALNYYDMGQGQPMKNDHIALPDFPSGAMENWGMVNYREAYLLYDPANTNLNNKIFIATIMAHELAHKWFGNLVTCFWWSNLWLNESFASFYEYFGAHYADESLELADQFVVDYVHSALNWDSGTTATPMNWTNVVDNPSVSAHFSTTSYAKGASVLRMMEHFVGARNFRNALRYYLRDNAYGIGTPEAMYAAFRRAVAEDSSFAQMYPNIDVGAVFDRWVQTPGSPVLNVDVNMSNGEITITQGVTDQHSYAADIGLKITNELDDYFALNYYDMGQGQPMKNDHIALPDFPSGAMENWGMVNYREAYLLYDPANTNLNNKIFIATIMAHELAHKWFGNLVTCFWWSNLWLNESFASFYEYFGAHYADESLELADQFVVDYVHSALNWDSGTTATPMNWTNVVDNPSVSAHFSTTSYAKGASVLRMMEHFVGARNFRNALRYYLRDNAYGIGTPEAMYAAFRRAVAEDSSFAQMYPNIDVGAVFDRWVQTPGSPVLNVDVNMSNGEITITQERFLINGNTNNDLWLVPVSWTHSGAINFQNTRPDFVLTQKTTVINKDPGHHWVILNVAQSGLYRVNYDDHNWEMIAAALRSNRNSIHKLNRAQIVNDVLHFIRASKITTARAFDVLSFLSSETDYYVWAGALTQLDWIRRRLVHLPSAHEEFSAYLLELMGAAITELGYEDRANDSTSTILARMIIMNYACNTLHHEGCVNYATQRWRQYRQNDNNLVPVNARRYVYCTGIRNGDSSDYNFLFQKYNSSENTADMVVILRTLACTKDAASLEHYLYQSMYNDRIRIHDRTNAFNFALQGNPENLATILSFLERHFADIRETYGGDARLNTCISALSTYLTDFEDITRFQTWLYATQIALGTSFSTGVSVINTSINNLVWGNTKAPDIFVFLRSRNSAAGITAPFILLLVAMATHMFNK